MIPILSAMILLALLLCILIYHDTHHFVIRTYHLTSSKIQKDLTIVLVSDLHGQDYGSQNERLLSEIRKIHPELILCAGDMVTSYHHLNRQTYERDTIFFPRCQGNFRFMRQMVIMSTVS